MRPARETPTIGPIAKWRFISNITIHHGGCWEWNAGCFRTGYGCFRFNKQSWPAHRFGYMFMVGPIDIWQVVDHRCRNKKCVNPDHLEPVTVKENIRRGETGIHNYSKTHCLRGHEYTPGNTQISTYGWRRCRTCHNLRRRNLYWADRQ